jgi:chromosomal replication initiation ATPase DnaA
MALERAGRLDVASLDARLAGAVVMEGTTPCDSSRRLLLARVAKHFEVAIDELCGRSRNARLNDGRAVAVAVLHREGASLSELASMFGKRDKSTIHGLCERGRALLESNESLRMAVAG